MTSLPERLQADLKAAMRARDQAAVRAIRSALAAFANAEAPPLVGTGPAESHGVLVEHARLELTDDDHQRLLGVELAERRTAVAEYESIGRPAEAAEVAAELAALARYLD